MSALFLLAAGCKNLDKTPRDDQNAEAVSRPKRNWLQGPTPGLDRAGTPPADTWNDPKNPNFDVDRAERGMLAGFVEDPDGHKVRDAYIEVEAVGAGQDGKPVGVMTTQDGQFLIRGLKPKQTYQLTTTIKTADGRVMSGRVYQTPGGDRSRNIRIALIDGLEFPASARGASLPGSSPNGIMGASGVLPDPVKLRDSEGLNPPQPVNAVPEYGTPTRNATRQDLITETQGSRPPVTSIPTPTVIPPKPPVIPESQSRLVRPGVEFTLKDAGGSTYIMPSGRTGELVLLDFMTTWCGPCKKAIPHLKDLSSRYSSKGVQVVGVMCDDVDNSKQGALATEYARKFDLSYPLLFESGTRRLESRFGIEGYPTLILLGPSGEVLWRGHPRESRELEEIINRSIR